MVAAVIVDDSDLLDVSYSGSQWTHESNVASLFNRTLTVCNTKNQNTAPAPSSFSLSFSGSDINIYGQAATGTALNYSLDDAGLVPGTISSDSNAKNGVNIWSLEDLNSATIHTVKVVPTAGQFGIDFITYTPTQSTTSLAGRNLILDDADESILYSADWVKTTGDFPIGLPYKGTMSGTNVTLSSITLDFVGSSISVNGLLNQKAGKLSVSFSIDAVHEATYVPFDGTQVTNESSWTLSQQFFHQTVEPGSHTLFVSLEEVTGSQMLWIDSIVYEGTTNTSIILPTQASTTSSSPKVKNGTITGIVIAVVVLVILGAFGRRAQRRRLVAVPVNYVETTTMTTRVIYA